MEFKARSTTRDKEGRFIVIKGWKEGEVWEVQPDKERKRQTSPESWTSPLLVIIDRKERENTENCYKREASLQTLPGK